MLMVSMMMTAWICFLSRMIKIKEDIFSLILKIMPNVYAVCFERKLQNDFLYREKLIERKVKYNFFVTGEGIELRSFAGKKL